jgi:epoxide hydrolase 4
VEHGYVRLSGIHLHVVRAGPEGAPLVILLHGFPEFWYGWRKQIPFLAEAGYRVWAPDGRGYNLSDKPEGIAAYRIDELTKDVLGLIDAAGENEAAVVGHDWGAAVAWRLAERHPERLSRLVILNAPHHEVFFRTLRSSLTQLRRSSYALFFQLPWLPEALLRRRNWQAVVEALRRSSRPGTFGEADFERYREAWSQPCAFSAMLNWYRAAARRPRAETGSRIRVPTLLIWGANDAFLGREMAAPSIALCDEGELIILEEATHWLQHEEPERVNGLIEAFLRQPMLD